jgi:hypothetical protein
LIWIRKLRPLVLASMVLLHAANDLMLGLTEFGLTMVAVNLSFVSGEWLRGRFWTARPSSTTAVRLGAITEWRGDHSPSMARRGGQRVASS